MIAAIEAGVVTSTTKSRLVELEAESANIERGIARESIDDPILTHDVIVFFLERIRDADMRDERHRARLIKTFVNSVFLYDDDDDPTKKGDVVLCMNYTDEHGKICKITLSNMEKAVFNGVSPCSSFAPSVALKKLDISSFQRVDFRTVYDR